MTVKAFTDCTQQYILFRRAWSVSSPWFKVVVAAEILLGAAALALALLGSDGLVLRLFFAAAAGLLAWQAISTARGWDTRNYLRKARAHELSPEDAERELAVSFDDKGCTLRAVEGTLPGQEVEERFLFSYDQVTGLFRSEEYLLAACKSSSSVCVPLASLCGGTEEAFLAFLEAQCKRRIRFFALNTAALQALLK